LNNLIYIINGPNLNKLGVRETDKYGSKNILDLKKLCEKSCKKHNITMDFFQSNNESDIIDKIHEAKDKASAILINAAAFTHTSVAILDALSIFDRPIIEIHITNIHSREEFRHKSFISNIAYGIIAGFGFKSYELAIEAIKHKLDNNKD
tara:strand:- start:228 stop:677 length:450 start_codon:yes stop_codon:yes gene_type:complete